MQKLFIIDQHHSFMIWIQNTFNAFFVPINLSRKTYMKMNVGLAEKKKLTITNSKKELFRCYILIFLF